MLFRSLKNHVSPDITDADAAAAVRALPVSFGQLSRASDLPVWLAWGVLDYVQFTGDTSLLDKRTPYAQTRSLADHEHDNCGLMPLATAPTRSTNTRRPPSTRRCATSARTASR